MEAMRNYNAYLNSESWKRRRNKFLRKRNRANRCKLCFGHGPVDVHHVTYARVGRELASDLKALCRDCHQFVHDCIRVGNESNPSRYFYNRLARAWNREASKKNLWGLRFTDPVLFKEKAMAFFHASEFAQKTVQLTHLKAQEAA
jgi:hypothetical protein